MTDRLLESPESSTGLPPRLGAVLAYSAWWITGLLVWWLERRDPFVRFHAAQSVVAFGVVGVIVGAFGVLAVVSLSVLPDAFAPLLWAAGLAWAGGEALWVIAIWQASQGRWWRIPLCAGIAERLSIGDS